jgi:hypothetical protein
MSHESTEPEGFDLADIEEIVRRIREGGAEGRRIGARRPDAGSLATMTSAYCGSLWIDLLIEQESHYPRV